ncbi:MAG: SDR family oxidoreductase [Leptospira sp.]|nr:SDR family oxidoreductase [Leptospira sp.]NCS92599.1 SDR family oxidoreductase [Leptospira sp.]
MKKTAYITGASSGIGEEFAKQLAKDYNVVLIARNQSKLEAIANELNTLHPSTQTSYLNLDLTISKDLNTFCQALEKDSSLGILVNNAGFGTVGEFAELDLQEELREVQLNVTSLVAGTHAALQNMKKQKSGTIINVASIAAYLPAPFSATYAATKAYVRSFSESIHEEAKLHGILIQALCPGLTHSDFHQRAGIEKENFPKFMWMSATDVVETSLKSINSKQAICIPGAVNQSAVGLTNLIPSSLTRKVAGMLMKK